MSLQEYLDWGLSVSFAAVCVACSLHEFPRPLCASASSAFLECGNAKDNYFLDMGSRALGLGLYRRASHGSRRLGPWTGGWCGNRRRSTDSCPVLSCDENMILCRQECIYHSSQSLCGKVIAPFEHQSSVERLTQRVLARNK
jgi:hypothetical protein